MADIIAEWGSEVQPSGSGSDNYRNNLGEALLGPGADGETEHGPLLPGRVEHAPRPGLEAPGHEAPGLRAPRPGI